MRQERQKIWLGANTKTSPTDILPVEFTQLKNFNPFKTPGKLVPDMGYDKKFADSQTNCEVLGSIKRDNGDIVTFSNNGNALVYWVNSGSRTAISGTYIKNNRRTINERYELRINGEGYGGTFDATTEPLWFARIDRGRFNTAAGAADPPSYSQSVADYFLYPKRCSAPNIITSGTPSEYDLKVTLTANGSGSVNDTLSYKFTYVYDGFQESPLSNGVSVALSSNTDALMQLVIGDDCNRRITAINVYRASDGFTYKYLRSISLVEPYYIYSGFYPTVDSLLAGAFAWTVDGNSDYTLNANLSDDASALTTLYDDRIEYTTTQKTACFYKYGVMFKDRMYAADVSMFNADNGDFDNVALETRDKKRLVYSPLYQYDVLPATLSVRFPDDITGLAYTDNHVMVFTKKDVFFLIEGAITDRNNWNGCWASDSIAYDGRYVFWLNRSGVKMWQGLQIVDITYEKIKDVIDGLSDAEVAEAFGVIEPNEREYYLFLPTSESVWVYNIRENQWRERDYAMNFVSNDVDGELIATDGTYIYNLLSGYDYDGTGYTCEAYTKEFELDPNGYFDLMRLWVRHRNANGGMAIRFLIGGTVQRTVFLSTQASLEAMDDYSLVADNVADPLFGRNIQLKFELATPDSNDSIDSVAFDYQLRRLL